MSKRPMIILLVLVFLVTGIGITWYLRYDYGDRQAAKKRFRDQVGSYMLDIKKTRLGPYSKDSAYYQNLRITFYEDSTFSTNMDVPFIYDSSGRWKAGGGGPEDWNWLYYNSNANIETQFDQCCLADSTFYLNSTTPHEGKEHIQRIYFKRM